MKKKSNFILIFVLLTIPALADEKQKTLEAIQKRYESVNTFQAHFIQRAYIKIMDQEQKSEGEVLIKKPGKMKWVYNAPDPQILISDNQTLWLYAPEENQVTKTLIKDIYTKNTPAVFLSGKGKLVDAFQIKKITRDSEIIKVSLIPEKEEFDLKELVLFANNKNYQIIGSKVYDRFGNETEIQFSNIKTNFQIPDQLFDFKIPDGVDLLDTTSPLEQKRP